MALRFTAETCGVLEMQDFTPTYMKVWTDVGTDDFVRTEISRMRR